MISNYDIFDKWELAAWSQGLIICVLSLGFQFINVTWPPQPLEPISAWSLQQSGQIFAQEMCHFCWFRVSIAPYQKFGFPGKNPDFLGKIQTSREQSRFSKSLDSQISIQFTAMAIWKKKILGHLHILQKAKIQNPDFQKFGFLKLFGLKSLCQKSFHAKNKQINVTPNDSFMTKISSSWRPWRSEDVEVM